jgi:AraC-like DNA-binding protein
MNYPHLRHLSYRQIQPHQALCEYVQCYWIIDNSGNVGKPVDEFMHPGGSTGIVFNLHDAVSMDGNIITDKFFVDGTNKVSRRLSAQGLVQAIGIQFSVTGTYALHGLPMNELLQDSLVYAPGNFKKLDTLHEQLINTTHVRERIAYLEQWLLNALDGAVETPVPVKEALPLIDASRGQLAIAELADELFISERQLERLFKTHIGISPKQYARLKRVARTRALLKQIDEMTLLEATQNAGYYDQSHFIREFKSIVGMTPGAYRQRIEARNRKLRED